MASHPGIVLRLLTWNLFHGRDFPPNPELLTLRSRFTRRPERDATHIQVNRSLRLEFGAALARWEWDVALLQEAPPRWLADLARASGATGEITLTSRNSLAPLRTAIAERNPDLIGSNEGGSNMVLVRSPATILAAEGMTLTTRPERRRMLMVRIRTRDGHELVVACIHLSVPSTGRSDSEALRAAECAVEWAGGDPLVLGGDFNLRPAQHPEAFEALRERFQLGPPTGPRTLDHLLARGLGVAHPPTAAKPAARDVPGPHGLAIRLSDHAPVTASFSMR